MAEDDFPLPSGDSCAPTLQAYKQYLTPLVDDYWQVKQYEAYAPDLKRWQQCCPGSAASVERLRPNKAILPSLNDIPLPGVFGKEAPCARAIHDQGFFTNSGQGELWLRAYSRKRQGYWSGEYASVRAELHGCCVNQFNACLEQAGQPGAPGGLAANEASAVCLRRFSPEHQERVIATPAEAERAACAAKLEQLRGEQVQAEAELRHQDARLCDQQLQAAAAAGKQATDKQAAAALVCVQEADRTKASLRSCEAAAAHAQQERDQLQAAMAKIVVRPGSEVLAGNPASTGSLEVALWGVCAVVAGFLLGLPGGTGGRAKLGSGTAGALLALLAYGGTVALLPDTKWPELLLACAVALLLISLGMLVRFSFLLRRRSHEALRAAGRLREDEIDLDEAERTLAGYREAGG